MSVGLVLRVTSTVEGSKTHKAADHRQAYRRKYGNKREEQLHSEATTSVICDLERGVLIRISTWKECTYVFSEQRKIERVW